MNLLISTLKIIFTFATVFFAALPFVFEYHTYLKDKEKKTANRRFRIMCFTTIYVERNFMVGRQACVAGENGVLFGCCWCAVN